VLMTMKLQPIQIQILTKLRHAPSGLRYRDMRPAEVENDLYNYHLQHLAKQQLIAKEGEYYHLSSFGKEQLIEISPLAAQHETNHKFKLAALCLVFNQGKVLYQIRGHHPFMGHKEIIGGSIMRGEPAIQAASRRLQEESGLEAEFTLFGLLRKTRFDNAGIASNLSARRKLG